MKKIHQLFFLFVLISGTNNAQTKQLNIANKKYEDYAYIDAREIYLKVAEKGYKSEDLLQKLGDSFYFNGELENALEWYAELINKYSDYDADYLFRYSQCLRSLKIYKEADKILKKYYYKKGIDPGLVFNDDDQNYLKDIEKQSGKFELHKFMYNSKLTDFSPHLHNGELIFASSRDTISSSSHDWNKEPFLDLYSLKNYLVKKFDPTINTKYHDASAVYTKSGDTLYFSRNNYNNNTKGRNKDGTILLKLYRAIKRKGKWKSVKELPFNSDQYSTSHPALSQDGKKLYFASDMPGGYGRSDLFVVDILPDGKYSYPKNLGPKINTIGRETFPFIASNNKLYFSSDGHFGLGGLDVFVTKINQKTQKSPVNVGKPINSEKDDFSFIIDDKTKKGYFASNRPGGKGGDDIYKCTQKEQFIFDTNQVFEGKIIDNFTGKRIESAIINIYDYENELLFTTESDLFGEFKIKLDCSKKYILRVKKESYQLREELIFVDNIPNKKNKIDIHLKQVVKLSLTHFSEGDDLNKVLKLSKIYFDYNRATLKSKSKVELQKVIEAMRANKKIKINIKSYTDYRGGVKYNIELSKKRSKSAKRYIVNEGGIDPSRITIEGLGESYSITNCDENCTEKELERDRRSEFVVF